jgi:hypothetical protein
MAQLKQCVGYLMYQNNEKSKIIIIPYACKIFKRIQQFYSRCKTNVMLEIYFTDYILLCSFLERKE